VFMLIIPLFSLCGEIGHFELDRFRINWNRLMSPRVLVDRPLCNYNSDTFLVINPLS